jgi:CRISPR-associated endoribonuclease Cas6
MLVNFYLEAVAEQFVKGVFMEQAFTLGDQRNKVQFTVKGVESMGMPRLTNKVQLRLHSPLVVGRKNERGHDDYLGPEEKGYADFLMQNLMDKYTASGGVLEPEWQHKPFAFTLLRYHKKPHRLVTVKEGTPAATRVKGYLFDFELTAPEELIEVGLLAGFGRENAMGFGYAEVLKSVGER